MVRHTPGATRGEWSSNNSRHVCPKFDYHCGRCNLFFPFSSLSFTFSSKLASTNLAQKQHNVHQVVQHNGSSSFPFICPFLIVVMIDSTNITCANELERSESRKKNDNNSDSLSSLVLDANYSCTSSEDRANNNDQNTSRPQDVSQTLQHISKTLLRRRIVSPLTIMHKYG